MVHESPWFLIFFFTYLKNRLRSTKAVPSRLELPADLAVWTIAHRLQWKSKSQVVFPAYAAGTFILLVFFMFLFLILFYTGTDSVYCKIYWICLIGTPIIVARTVGTAFEGFFFFFLLLDIIDGCISQSEPELELTAKETSVVRDLLLTDSTLGKEEWM